MVHTQNGADDLNTGGFNSPAVQSGIGDSDPLAGTIVRENDNERFQVGAGNGAKTHATSATVSSSKSSRASTDALRHALNDVGITMRFNRRDTMGFLSGCALALCENMHEISDRTMMADIFKPSLSTLVNAMEKSGMAIEIAMLRGLYNGLFSDVPDDHKVRDPDAGVLRQAIGMATDVLGINFAMTEWLGFDKGFGAPRRELDSGEVFSRSIQQAAGPGPASLYGTLSSSDVFTKLENFEKGGREKLMSTLEDYGAQLDDALKKRYPKLDENQRKTVVKTIGGEIGNYIASHGVREAEEGEKPGLYLNGIEKPRDKQGRGGGSINLNEPHDVGVLINMMVGPKLFVHPRIDAPGKGPAINIPDAAPDLSDKTIYPDKPLVEADSSVLKDRIAAAGAGKDGIAAAGTGKDGIAAAGAGKDGAGAQTDAEKNVSSPVLTAAQIGDANGRSRPALADGEIDLIAPPAPERGTLIMSLFTQAGITAQEMLQLLGLMGKDDRYEATQRANASGDDTTYIKVYDAAGNEKSLDKKGIDQRVPPELRGSDTELTIPEMRAMLAAQMLSPEKENNLAVLLQRRETINAMDATLNRLDIDPQALAAMLGGAVAVGKGKDHPITFTRPDGQKVTMPLKEYLIENPQRVDHLSEAIVHQVIAAIPQEKHAEAFGIKEGNPLEVVRFEGGKISAGPAQTLNEYLAQHPEAVEKGAYHIMQEREKTRNPEVGLEPEKPSASRDPIANTLQDLAKELGLQVHQAHQDVSATPDINAPGKATERLGKEGGSGGRSAGK